MHSGIDLGRNKFGIRDYGRVFLLMEALGASAREGFRKKMRLKSAHTENGIGKERAIAVRKCYR